MKKTVTQYFLAFLVLALPVAVIAGAVGGPNAGDFQATLDIMTDWIQGTLGQMVALSMIVVGIIAGIARQSLMAFVIGIGSGMGLSFAPAIITNVFAAAVPFVM